MVREKSCGIVVFYEKEGIREYLILHYPSGHWDLAKGHVEEGETEMETAIRELEEETGITDIDFVSEYKETIRYSYRRAGQMYTKDVIYFLARTNTKEVRLSHEHQGYVWLPYEQALSKVTFDNARELIEKAESSMR